MSETPSIQAKLGAQLRALRLKRGLSVRTLATRTGFSPSFISHLELEAVSPSIASLELIAKELGVTLSGLFGAIEATPRTVIRRTERASYQSVWSRSTVSLLADIAPNRELSAVEVRIDPGGTSGKHPAANLQESFAFLFSGTLLLTAADGPIELVAGDAVYLARGVPFAWENRGEDAATLLIVGLADRSTSPLGLPADDNPGDEHSRPR
jgi:transcriptional regulator with XRE-family HTH domain